MAGLEHSPHSRADSIGAIAAGEWGYRVCWWADVYAAKTAHVSCQSLCVIAWTWSDTPALQSPLDLYQLYGVASVELSRPARASLGQLSPNVCHPGLLSWSPRRDGHA